jgi:hypothetical protein
MSKRRSLRKRVRSKSVRKLRSRRRMRGGAGKSAFNHTKMSDLNYRYAVIKTLIDTHYLWKENGAWETWQIIENREKRDSNTPDDNKQHFYFEKLDNIYIQLTTKESTEEMPKVNLWYWLLPKSETEYIRNIYQYDKANLVLSLVQNWTTLAGNDIWETEAKKFSDILTSYIKNTKDKTEADINKLENDAGATGPASNNEGGMLYK